MKLKRIRVSDAQAKMIEHRLEVPDCIHDSISGDWDDTEDYTGIRHPMFCTGHWRKWTAGEVHLAANKLQRRMADGWLWCESLIEQDVLENAVASSTWYAVHEVESECVANGNLLIGRIGRTVVSATKKVAELIGREIVPVLW